MKIYNNNKTERIKAVNDFHNTEINLRVPAGDQHSVSDVRFWALYQASAATHKKVWRELCGVKGCKCGIITGLQPYDWDARCYADK